jgi:predicted dehydrogenase
MAIFVSPEQKEIGKAKFQEAASKAAPSRRDFLKGVGAAGAALGVGAGAYFGYQKLHGNPVRTGLIGAGDEGGVLVGEHNPEYLEFIAYSDIRPSNQKRIFTGEDRGPRKGFNRVYGSEAKKIKLYTDYKELLANKDIEAVVIALPLNLHAQVAIDAMRAGKHVLCEKLMAWNVAQCKDMIHTSDDTDRILTIGHQRHYSLLYAQALDIIKSGELGDIKHIRALWHRNNSWPVLNKEDKPVFEEVRIKGKTERVPVLRDGWRKAIPKEDREALENTVQKYGFKDMEELVRWRLFKRTGGGLMAELGSHQLDACSIFLGKVHPLAVSGYGGKIFYKDEREIDDHVFVTFEFPGKNYYRLDDDGNPTRAIKDKDDVVVVTYSSINTCSAEPYGENVFGTHRTLVVEKEEQAMLYEEVNPNKKATDKAMAVTTDKVGGGATAVESSGSGGIAGATKAASGGAAATPVSKGYREEMEHFAYCVRMHDKAAGDAKEREHWRRAPHCHGRVAMADAIIALTSNWAMHSDKKRIEFKEEWFDAAKPDVPEDPESKVETI